MEGKGISVDDLLCSDDRAERYMEYLQELEENKPGVLERCRGVCEGCGEDKAVDVHVKDWKVTPLTMMYNLVGVCDRCHKKLHILSRD